MASGEYLPVLHSTDFRPSFGKHRPPSSISTFLCSLLCQAFKAIGRYLFPLWKDVAASLFDHSREFCPNACLIIILSFPNLYNSQPFEGDILETRPQFISIAFHSGTSF